MTVDDYLISILNKYQIQTGAFSQAVNAYQTFYPLIKDCFKENLIDVSYSGSYAKGTGVRGSTDVDLFISLNSSTPGTLKDIYDGLYEYIINKGYSARKQNVSIGINSYGSSIDLVPARKFSGNTYYHTLFKNKTQSWMQTNVQNHINLVKDSGRINEIKLLKIWRNLHNLNFPSFYLEMTVINALYNKRRDQLGDNVIVVLEYLKNNFVDARIEDPSNSNNIVSDDLYQYEKKDIADTSKVCLGKTWSQVLW